jgi:hypothetical protein
MANRFEGRLRKLEALQGEEVDAILDGLDGYQSEAILLSLIAFAEGEIAQASGLPVEDGPSDERLRQTPFSGARARYEQVLASIPPGVPERLMAAIVERAGETTARA